MKGYSSPIVIDNGDSTIKLGLAGGDVPISVPTLLLPQDGLPGEYYFGNEAIQKSDYLSEFVRPIFEGEITDIGLMEQLWDHAIDDVLKADIVEHPALLSEPVLVSDDFRRQIAELYFESYGSPAISFVSQPILGLYSMGFTNGIALDIGDGLVQVETICSSFNLKHARSKIQLGGRTVSEHIKDNLLSVFFFEKINLYKYNFHEVVTSIKKKYCEVMIDYSQLEEIKRRRDSEIKLEEEDENIQPFVLPDGAKINIDDLKKGAPEVFFTPSIQGKDLPPVHTLVYDNLMKADIDVRKLLLTNILTTGGSTLFKNFNTRLRNEVLLKSPGNTVKVNCPSDPINATWQGGSVIAEIDGFDQNWVTAEDYEESGPRVFLEHT